MSSASYLFKDASATATCHHQGLALGSNNANYLTALAQC